MTANNPQPQGQYNPGQANYQQFPPYSRAQIQMNSYTRQPVGYSPVKPTEPASIYSQTIQPVQNVYPQGVNQPQQIPAVSKPITTYNSLAQSQTPQPTAPNNTKNMSLIVFGITAVILLLITGVSLFVLNQQGYFGTSQVATTSSSSQSSTGTSSSRQAFYFPRFFNPRENPSNSSIPAADSPLPENSQSQAPRSLPAMATVNIAPKDNAKLDRKQFQSLTCSANNFTTHGVVEIRNMDNPGTSMLVASSDMILTPRDQANYDRANNFIQKNTDFMADRDTDFGPDFLQFFRKDCAKSQIQRFKEFENIKLEGGEVSRVIADIRGQNETLDVAVSVLSKKDKNVILITRTWAVQEFFSREQIQKCATNNTPNRSCFRDLLDKETTLQRRLEEEAVRIAKVYAI